MKFIEPCYILRVTQLWVLIGRSGTADNVAVATRERLR